MHIAKVESVVELRQDEGCPGGTRSTGYLDTAASDSRDGAVSAERPGQSGTYAKAQAPWLPPTMLTLRGPKVYSADELRHFEEPPACVSPEGSCRLVVLEHGAQWPEWLAQGLSGGVTTYLVAEAVGDGLGGLVRRVEKRSQHCEVPVGQLIWLSAQSKRLAPLRWIKRLSAKIMPYETLVIVPSATSRQSVSKPSRYGARRHQRQSTWPRAVVA
jgi:hypothetical protein